MWHRQAAALAAAADRVGVAEADLPAVRARLRTQQASFAQVATATGVPLPTLEPSPTDISAAMPALGDLSAGAVAAALETVSSTLDATDAALAAHRAPATPVQAAPAPVPPPAPVVMPLATGLAAPAAPAAPAPMPATGAALWPVGLRNALVYGGYSLVVLVVQLVLLALVDEERLPMLSPMCLIILPAFAWAAGWFTIGAAFRPAPGVRVRRTPRLGVLVCLMPNLLLCAGIGVLYLAR
jgi:hypothetical protein